jgi:translation initiation factor 4A
LLGRVGRAGRYGRKGIAITLITDSEKGKLEEIETFYNTRIDVMPVNISQLLQE